MEVVAFAFEEGVLFNVQNYVEIACGSTRGAGLAVPGKADAGAVFDTGGNFGFDGAFTQLTSFAFAFRARIGDDASSALTRRAGAGNAEESLLIANLAAAIAGAALDGSFPGSCACSATSLAGFVAADFNVLLHAKESFFKFQVEVFAEVGATLGARASPATAAEEVAEAEELPEEVAEILEDGGIESGRTSSAAAHSSVPEAVIQRSLLTIGENCVRFGEFLELLFRVRVVGVAVRMVRHRQLAVRTLDLHIGSRAGNAQHLVIITFCISRQKLPLIFFLRFLF